MKNNGLTGWFQTTVLLLCLLVNTVSLTAQNIDLNNRPVAKIVLEGVKPESQQLVRNQIRLVQGQPYDEKVVAQDIVRITHLGRFATVEWSRPVVPRLALPVAVVPGQDPDGAGAGRCAIGICFAWPQA